MARKRRSASEVAAAVKKVDRLVSRGMNVTAAVEKVGLSDSVYARAKRMNGGTTGSVRADSLPPRPGKKEKGKRARLNMHDIAAVGKAIKRLDERIASQRELLSERAMLADTMVNLLKKA